MRQQLAASILILALTTAGVTAAAAQPDPSTDPQTPSLTDGDAADPTTAPAPTADASASPSAQPAQAPSQQPQAVETDEVTFDDDAQAVVDVELGDAEVAVLGVSWDASDDLGTVEYRSRAAGADDWSAWQELDPASDGPEPGSGEAAQAQTGTEPVIVGDDAEVEFRTQHSAADAQVATATTTTTAADDTVARTASAAAAPAAASAPSLSYVTRRQWGADESLKKCSVDISPGRVQAMTVHHTAGATGYTKAQVPGILRGILKYHTQSLGWCDIGYNMLIDKYGGVYQGRSGSHSQSVIGAHASGFNTDTFGVSVMGTYSSPAPSAAIEALGRVGAWQAATWGYDPKGSVTLTSQGGTAKYKKGTQVRLPRIFAHRDTGYTECPGNGLYGQMAAIRSSAAKQLPSMYTVRGAIGTYYSKHKATTGAPLMDERQLYSPRGAYQRFANGSVHWSSSTGAHFTHRNGKIQRKWAEQKYERGPLGYPATDQTRLRYRSQADYQRFQGGSIVSHPATGTHSMVGAIRSKWKALGWERSYLRLPTTDERQLTSPRGAYQHFEGGSIHWSKATGAHATTGAIRTAWSKQKWERGRLGFPKTDEYAWKGKVRQDFQGGYITWSRSEGARIRYT